MACVRPQASATRGVSEPRRYERTGDTPRPDQHESSSVISAAGVVSHWARSVHPARGAGDPRHGRGRDIPGGNARTRPASAYTAGAGAANGGGRLGRYAAEQVTLPHTHPSFQGDHGAVQHLGGDHAEGRWLTYIAKGVPPPATARAPSPGHIRGRGSQILDGWIAVPRDHAAMVTPAAAGRVSVMAARAHTVAAVKSALFITTPPLNGHMP
jgi:hypothetical protein